MNIVTTAGSPDRLAVVGLLSIPHGVDELGLLATYPAVRPSVVYCGPVNYGGLSSGLIHLAGLAVCVGLDVDMNPTTEDSSRLPFSFKTVFRSVCGFMEVSFLLRRSTINRPQAC